MVKNLTDIYKLETSQHVNPHLFLSAFISVPTSAIADMIQGKILFTNIKKINSLKKYNHRILSKTYDYIIYYVETHCNIT